jgi:hypothetical protein
VYSSLEINKADRDGNTALHWAVTLEMTDAALGIIKSPFKVDAAAAEKKSGRCALHMAASTGQTAVVEALAHGKVSDCWYSRSICALSGTNRFDFAPGVLFVAALPERTNRLVCGAAVLPAARRG